ncbi:MAG: branched-chain amino acid aminotransferase [Oscillospiraceae bacterium]|jgi:branched-chain amino acid aminotransferase|nr:branched-chain amino acid aminotransferase [Oscillospiraceae bacterium]
MKMISINLTKSKKPIPADETKLGFGRVFSDHMFVMQYDRGQGWHDARITPFAEISLSPAAMVLHYSQTIFEGLKAYRRADGGVQLFRPEENVKRLNLSAERLVIPQVPEDVALQGLKELVRIDKDWVPHSDGASLYLRPFVIAVDPFVGVRPADSYLFFIIASPSGAYYESGLNPVAIKVEEKYVRAVKGGMGYTKTGGNYAASLIGQDEAHKEGFSQVLWLDGVEHKYIEEVGAMNIFFKINGEVVTPELSGSILGGITRKSVIELLKTKGIPVSERRIAIDEIAAAYDSGTLEEVFGTGTAAVISPVGSLKYQDKTMDVGGGKIGEVSAMLYDTLTGIQYGRLADKLNWIVKVD